MKLLKQTSLKVFLSLIAILLAIFTYFILNLYIESKNLSLIKINQKYGYKNSKDEIIVKPIYDKVQITPEGLIVVIKNNKLGLIDRNGKILFEPKYKTDLMEYRFHFSDGLAAVIKETNGQNNCVYIDKNGKEVLDPLTKGYSTVQDGDYGSCSDFSEGLAAVNFGKNGEYYGYINKQGELVIILEEVMGDAGDCFPIGQFSEGLANVPINNKYGYINKRGEFVIKPQFAFAEPFKKGKAIVRISSSEDAINQIFYIDKKGKILSPVD